VTGNRGWRDDALCRQVDPELFFPRVNRPTTAQAKQVCRRCPVRGECLAEALRRRERYGVWGGLTAAERRALLIHAATTAASVAGREAA
jgi:WhiB family redox-sensing transcriptional regulator